MFLCLFKNIDKTKCLYQIFFTLHDKYKKVHVAFQIWLLKLSLNVRFNDSCTHKPSLWDIVFAFNHDLSLWGRILWADHIFKIYFKKSNKSPRFKTHLYENLSNPEWNKWSLQDNITNIYEKKTHLSIGLTQIFILKTCSNVSL